jgi:hypothetical protein
VSAIAVEKAFHDSTILSLVEVVTASPVTAPLGISINSYSAIASR